MVKEGLVKTRKKEIKENYAICPYCKKEIKGSSKESVENNLEVHIRTKHKTKHKEVKK